MLRHRHGPWICSVCWSARHKSKRIYKRTNRTFRPPTAALSSVSDLLNEARGLARFSLRIDHHRRPTGHRGTANRQYSCSNWSTPQTSNSMADTCSPVPRPGYSRFHWPPAMCNTKETTLTLQSYSDIDLLFPTNVSGSDVFGALSAPTSASVDLNPSVTSDTALADLNGGLGVNLGSIKVSDGTSERIIDLSSASTLQDVKQLLEAQPADGTLPPVLNVQIANNWLTGFIGERQARWKSKKWAAARQQRGWEFCAQTIPPPA